LAPDATAIAFSPSGATNTTSEPRPPVRRCAETRDVDADLDQRVTYGSAVRVLADGAGHRNLRVRKRSRHRLVCALAART
jgi:hypothetical protein